MARANEAGYNCFTKKKGQYGVPRFPDYESVVMIDKKTILAAL